MKTEREGSIVDINKQNKLSGEDLKKLMTNGKLPDEYISEENLNILLNYEYELMGDNEYYDINIIKYCSGLLCRYEKDYELQEKNIWRNLQEEINLSAAEKSKGVRKRRFQSFLKVSAACIALILSAQIIAAVAFDMYLLDWSKFLSLLGIESQYGNISQSTSFVREYNTLEEFEAAENIDIIVPSWFPQSIEIGIISYGYNYEIKKINLIYNDYKTSLSIELNSTIPNMDGSKVYENNNIIFHIFSDRNIIMWQYNGNFYNLNCAFDIDENVEEIIKNIK